MLVRPENGRAKIHELGKEIRIIIPSRKNWFTILFMGFWLCGWAVGEFSVPLVILSDDAPGGMDIFLIAWLVAWTVGGILAIRNFLWNLIGHEEIIISSNTISIARKIAGIGRNKEYLLSEAKRFRVSLGRSSPWANAGRSLDFWGLKQGRIKFDYGMKTIRFAGPIDEAEATNILELLKSRGFIREANVSM